jgi:hypothetical protein
MSEIGTRAVAFVPYPGLTPLDLIGPLQVLNPQPPFGGIDWRQVDRDAQVLSITALIQSALADHPNLVNRLTGPPSAPG